MNHEKENWYCLKLKEYFDEELKPYENLKEKEYKKEIKKIAQDYSILILNTRGPKSIDKALATKIIVLIIEGYRQYEIARIINKPSLAVHRASKRLYDKIK